MVHSLNEMRHNVEVVDIRFQSECNHSLKALRYSDTLPYCARTHYSFLSTSYNEQTFQFSLPVLLEPLPVMRWTQAAR